MTISGYLLLLFADSSPMQGKIVLTKEVHFRFNRV
jgi:hypothetical protein